MDKFLTAIAVDLGGDRFGEFIGGDRIATYDEPTPALPMLHPIVPRYQILRPEVSLLDPLPIRESSTILDSSGVCYPLLAEKMSPTGYTGDRTRAATTEISILLSCSVKKWFVVPLQQHPPRSVLIHVSQGQNGGRHRLPCFLDRKLKG